MTKQTDTAALIGRIFIAVLLLGFLRQGMLCKGMPDRRRRRCHAKSAASKARENASASRTPVRGWIIGSRPKRFT